jgi:hypothetical protein
VSALAELSAVGPATQLAERRDRDLYGRALVALARRGAVPTVALGHLAIRVLMFLLGQRPGYFAHQKVIASAVESNLTSVRGALSELRDAGLVYWKLIPPHHVLPTGKHTRTNVNQYFVEAEALLRALDGGPRRTVAPMHPDSIASTGMDPRFEQNPPPPPRGRPRRRTKGRATEGENRFSGFQGAEPENGQTGAAGVRRAHQGQSQTAHAEFEQVFAAWRGRHLRSQRTLLQFQRCAARVNGIVRRLLAGVRTQSRRLEQGRVPLGSESRRERDGLLQMLRRQELVRLSVKKN